jgi:hypothetical protein
MLDAETLGDIRTPPIAPNNTLIDPQTQRGEYLTFIATATNDPPFDIPTQYSDRPELVVGTEDWAFQGVGLAFFESLMGNFSNEEAEWTSTPDTSTNNYRELDYHILSLHIGQRPNTGLTL